MPQAGGSTSIYCFIFYHYSRWEQVMTSELLALMGTAGGVGFIHTILGPDHYIPFIMMSVSRKWSRGKTAWITFLCGLGHIAGSILLGVVGIGLGLMVKKLTFVESVRGDIAAWLLTGFGLVYLIWGLRRAYKNRPHSHTHSHSEEVTHTHHHDHHHDHAHVHDVKKAANLTPWAIFIIFVLGPCEPLIPILMYPAAKSSILGVVLVTAVFGAVTIATMMGAVLVGTFGVSFLPMARLERYTHALAGGAIFACGLAIHLGL